MKKYFRTLKYFFIQNHSSMSGTLNQKLTTKRSFAEQGWRWLENEKIAPLSNNGSHPHIPVDLPVSCQKLRDSSP
jgi:hypothetical protein